MSSRAARPVSVAAPISLAAKPPCKIDPTAIISDKAILVGSHPISIGANTVLHPFAKLDSTHSPLTIEDYCIVCERATVGHVNPANGDSAITIRSHVNIETGSTVEAVEIGKGCHIGAYAIVESDSKLGQVSIHVQGMWSLIYTCSSARLHQRARWIVALLCLTSLSSLTKGRADQTQRYPTVKIFKISS